MSRVQAVNALNCIRATTGQILCLVLRPRACILGHTKANKRQMGATNIIIESCQSRKIVRKLCGQCGGHRAWLRDSLKVVRRVVLGGQTSESLAGLLKHPPSQPAILCRLAMDRANNDCRQTWLEGLATAGRGCCTVGRTEACPPVQAGRAKGCGLLSVVNNIINIMRVRK